jgi:hypothetical protein
MGDEVANGLDSDVAEEAICELLRSAIKGRPAIYLYPLDLHVSWFLLCRVWNPFFENFTHTCRFVLARWLKVCYQPRVKTKTISL